MHTTLGWICGWEERREMRLQGHFFVACRCKCERDLNFFFFFSSSYLLYYLLYGNVICMEGESNKVDETTPPRPRGRNEVYDEDSGIILCICGFEEDDGFTIQCERCNVWQHAQCVDISEDEVPDIYYCDKCDQNPHRVVDVRAAVERQQRIVNGEQHEKEQKEQQLRPPTKPQRRKGSKGKGLNNNNSNNNAESDTSSTTTMTANNNDATNNNENNVNDLPRPTLPPAPPRRGRGKRLTVQASKAGDDAASESEHDQDISKYFTSASSYKSFFVKADICKIPRSLKTKMEEYLATTALELCQHDDQCSFLTSQEFNHITPAKVTVKFAYENQKQKFYGFSKFGLFAETPIPRDRFLIEFVGDLMQLEDYKRNPINQYRFFGCAKAGVLFYEKLRLAIDGRLVGSEASFIRRSCRPNVKVSAVVVDDKVLRFAAFATEPIKSGTEITMGWDWDPRHPVTKLLEQGPDALNKVERECLLRTSDMIRERGMDCACNNQQDCVMIQMRRAGMVANDRPGSSPIMGYSAREERKIQGAMSLIDKLEKKKKRKSTDGGEQQTPAVAPTVTQNGNINVATPQKDKSIQTEQPALKKLKRPNDNVQLPSPTTAKSFCRLQTLRAKFLKARQDYLDKPPSAIPSPVLTGPVYTNRHSPSPAPESTKSPIATELGTTYTIAKPISTPEASQPAPSPVTTTTTKVQKKKLSFADYKKKQKPPQPASNNTTTK